MKSLPLQVRLLPLFKNLEDDLFANLSRGAVYKTYTKGDVICNKGDPSNGLFVLIRGELQLYESGREGQEVGLNLIKGPAVFGELGVIDDLPRSADVMAFESALNRAFDAARNSLLDRVQARIAHAAPLLTNVLEG